MRFDCNHTFLKSDCNVCTDFKLTRTLHEAKKLAKDNYLLDQFPSVMNID